MIDYSWDLTPILQGKELSSWFEEITIAAQAVTRLKNKIALNPDNFSKFHQASVVLNQKAELVAIYLENQHNADLANEAALKQVQRYQQLMQDISIKTDFVKLELVRNRKKIQTFLTQTQFQSFKHYYQDFYRHQRFLLPIKEEQQLSILSTALNTPDQVFSQLTDVDFKFASVVLPNKTTIELTQGTFSALIRHPDEEVRKQAYFNFWSVYQAHKHTLATCYHQSVITYCQLIKIRKYKDPLTSATYSDYLTPKFYTHILKMVKKHVGLNKLWKQFVYQSLHKHNPLPYEVSGQLFCLDNEQEETFTPQTAQELILKALAVLGGDYQQKLQCMFHDRLIDWMPRQNKRAGAYSISAWSSKPYVLLNWNGKYLDLSTLAHELGHALHSLYTNSQQVFIYHDYPIFLAEIASIVNELLLMDYLLTTTPKNKLLFQCFLLENVIKEFVSTVYRQAVFADFEAQIHAKVFADEQLSPNDILALYRHINDQYYPLLAKETNNKPNDFTALTALYVPHFYRDFYVYKYIIGMICACNVVVNLKANPHYRENYLNFLRSGSSREPLVAIKEYLGIDLTTQRPFVIAFQQFKKYFHQLKKNYANHKHHPKQYR